MALSTALLPALLLLMSAGLQTLKHQPPPPNWQLISLSDGWQLKAPIGFVNEPEQGIDSQPGMLACAHDSLYLAYDIGREMSGAPECSFSWSVELAQQRIRDGYYAYYNRPSLVHTATLDTINGKVAVLIRPVVSGTGTVAISITDCQTGKWIHVSGQGLSAGKQQLALAMFRTLQTP